MPPEATFKGYEDFFVQDLILKPRVTRYRRERWRTKDGRTLVAALSADFVPGSHFGLELIGFILHQYHHQHVTQPLLLEQLLGDRVRGLGQIVCLAERIRQKGKEPRAYQKGDTLPDGAVSGVIV